MRCNCAALSSVLVAVTAGCDTSDSYLARSEQRLSGELSRAAAAGEPPIGSHSRCVQRLLEPATVSRWQRRVLRRGLRRQVRLQADIVGDNARNGYVDEDPDDGGWDFDLTPATAEHSSAPSPSNTYGVTAIGGWMAGLVSRGSRLPVAARWMVSALDTFIGAERRAEVDSAPDFAFFALLTLHTHNPGFAEMARERYEAKVSAAGTPQALGQDIRQRRGNAGQAGLIPFDLGWLVVAALSLDTAFPGQGYADHARVYGGIVADDIVDPSGFFKPNDAAQAFHTQGLAWAAIALHCGSNRRARAQRLRRRLLRRQLADGSWPWNETFAGSDYQSTAAALLGLRLLPARMRPARAAAGAAVAWLASRQLPNGGWQYAPGRENTEVNSEILLALALAEGHGHRRERRKRAPAGDDGVVATLRSGLRQPRGERPIASPLDLDG